MSVPRSPQAQLQLNSNSPPQALHPDSFNGPAKELQNQAVAIKKVATHNLEVMQRSQDEIEYAKRRADALEKTTALENDYVNYNPNDPKYKESLKNQLDNIYQNHIQGASNPRIKTALEKAFAHDGAMSTARAMHLEKATMAANAEASSLSVIDQYKNILHRNPELYEHIMPKIEQAARGAGAHISPERMPAFIKKALDGANSAHVAGLAANHPELALKLLDQGFFDNKLDVNQQKALANAASQTINNAQKVLQADNFAEIDNKIVTNWGDTGSIENRIERDYDNGTLTTKQYFDLKNKLFKRDKEARTQADILSRGDALIAAGIPLNTGLTDGEFKQYHQNKVEEQRQKMVAAGTLAPGLPLPLLEEMKLVNHESTPNKDFQQRLNQSLRFSQGQDLADAIQAYNTLDNLNQITLSGMSSADVKFADDLDYWANRALLPREQAQQRATALQNPRKQFERQELKTIFYSGPNLKKAGLDDSNRVATVVSLMDLAPWFGKGRDRLPFGFTQKFMDAAAEHYVNQGERNSDGTGNMALALNAAVKELKRTHGYTYQSGSVDNSYGTFVDTPMESLYANSTRGEWGYWLENDNQHSIDTWANTVKEINGVKYKSSGFDINPNSINFYQQNYLGSGGVHLYRKAPGDLEYTRCTVFFEADNLTRLNPQIKPSWKAYIVDPKTTEKEYLTLPGSIIPARMRPRTFDEAVLPLLRKHKS